MHKTNVIAKIQKINTQTLHRL